MRIAERLLSPSPCFSFEFFPPKTEAGVASLFQTLAELKELEPAFVSITYGAGGSTQRLTQELAGRIRREVGIEAMAHLTCVGHSEEQIGAVLDRLRDEGIENVICLRGDPPRGPEGLLPFTATPGGFDHADQLLRYVRQGRRSGRWSFCLGGACHPEGHLESASQADEMTHLSGKVEAGAEFLITQLFFDNAFYFDFVERAARARIRVPILPGIMPITDFGQIDRMTRLCGATIPMRLRLQLERYQHDPEAILQLGVAHATVQCMDLLARGAPGVHFYTLNRSKATRLILSALRGAK